MGAWVYPRTLRSRVRPSTYDRFSVWAIFQTIGLGHSWPTTGPTTRDATPYALFGANSNGSHVRTTNFFDPVSRTSLKHVVASVHRVAYDNPYTHICQIIPTATSDSTSTGRWR